MDAQERTPPEDLASFVSGMEFGLLTLQGRLRQLEDPTAADLLAAIEDVRERGQRIRRAQGDDRTSHSVPR